MSHINDKPTMNAFQCTYILIDNMNMMLNNIFKISISTILLSNLLKSFTFREEYRDAQDSLLQPGGQPGTVQNDSSLTALTFISR